ncbi:hypothetical protein KCV04_g1562, partial [Aureobasidium melanogenum]
PPPRRNLSHYPVAAASYATNRLSGAWNDSSFHDPLDPEGGPILSKKEELWKRRWAKAKSIMEREGVVLRTWRVGNDVMDVCVETVRQELVEMEKKDRRDLEMQKLRDREKEGGRGNGGGRQGTLI